MSEVGANTPANHFGGSFGPNEWLVQEMYERYQADPSSVDKAWWDFFADFKTNSSLNGTVISPIPVTKPGTPPIPKSQLAKSAQAAPTVTPAQIITPAPVEKIEQIQVANTPVKPADPVVKPIPTLITPAASSIEPLRGVAARVVQSMEGSLTVPTATTVS